MPLPAGTRLGPYEILAPIGKGGMGEVYRAHDTRLRRDVAIKVSAERFGERFEREARAIASLNHPNICHLYDVGPDYLVMELVEGENLKGPLPLATALDYARQIAEALEAAHEKGIVHRDLKPANIRIKPDGTVKVLDFGLAKQGRDSGGAVSENSPTMTMGATEAGVILGTAAYMAPEQAKGKPVDKRADIWAFGVVLYEMLTGERMFHGETATEVLASVLKEEPKFDRVPEKVRPLLRRCLEKDPKKRLRDIGEAMVWVDVEQAFGLQSQAKGLLHSKLPWALAAAAVVALAAVSWMLWPRETDRPLVRQDVDLGPEIFLRGPVRFVTNVVISPDGSRLAFVARSAADGPLKLFTRRLDQPKAIELAGTEGAIGPFFSPDGQWLGFDAAGKLSKVSVEGGAAIPLAPLTSQFTGASWGKDGILFGQLESPMLRIPSTGGEATPLTEIGSSPQLLPGGKAVLFAQNTSPSPDTATVEVLSLEDRRRKTLVHGGAFPRFVASDAGSNRSGHLLYVFNGAVFALQFDLDSLEAHGTPVRVLDDLAGVANRTAGKFDVSQTGTLVYQKGSVAGLLTARWLDAAGRQEPILASPAAHGSLRLSPDGRRLVFWGPDGAGNNAVVQVYEFQTGRTTKVANGGPAVFSPDGLFVVFEGNGDSRNDSLQWARADGASQPQPLLAPGRNEESPGSFSPDGKLLAYTVAGGPGSRGTDYPIWTVPIVEQDGQLKAGMPVQFLKDQVVGVRPALSPDGKWLAYSSFDSGTTQNVFVRSFQQPASGSGGKWAISLQGGGSPVWSRMSSELLYLDPTGQIMAVRYVVKGDTFVADKPRAWAETRGVTDFDLAPDGKRVAVTRQPDTTAEPMREHEVVFLENFFDELRRRAPAEK